MWQDMIFCKNFLPSQNSDLTKWLLDHIMFYVKRMNEWNVRELETPLHKSEVNKLVNNYTKLVQN